MIYPRVEIDLAKLRHNVQYLSQYCERRGIAVAAVTKVTAAYPEIARVIYDGGVCQLADSRLENLKRLRFMFPDAELVLLRLPMLSQADEVVQTVDISLASELETLRALNEAARKADTEHGILLMIDLGDLREGAWPDEAVDLARAFKDFPYLNLEGVGTNLACYGGVIPNHEKMAQLVSIKEQIEEVLATNLRWVSGGNSANWKLLESGEMPKGINHLRIGEALLLGRETVNRTPIDSMHQDVFTLCAEVIELKTKPSAPIGQVGQDAFGKTPTFHDRGKHRRAILAVGRQDVVPEGLNPEIPGMQILGASSDHLILDVEDTGPISLGDTIRFKIHGYSALLALFTSGYVDKVTF